jgi:putative transposase
MTNHIHLVAIPHKEVSLANAVGRTAFRYTQYVNRMHKRSGHLWEGRFYSCALDERHTWLAAKYVELNPVRARMCRLPWRYEWSSATAHTDEDAESLLVDLSKWYNMISAKQWRDELVAGLNETEMSTIRLRTHTGRPLGTDSFISKLEKLIGRRVRPLPIGRPKKRSAKS